MSSIRTQARGELSRLNVIHLLAFGMLLIFPATSEAQSPPIAEQIAKTYGLDSFGQIEAIRYTWNAELPGAKLSHMCEWNPKTDMVSYEGKDKEGKPVKVSYQRSQLSSQSERARYRCARPTPSISSDSACNARPVAGQMPSPRNRGEHSAEDVRRPRDTPLPPRRR